VSTQPAKPPTTVLDHVAGPLVAAHGHGSLHPWPLLALTLGTAALIYAMACWASPFAQCRRCDGNGKYRKRHGRAWHPCKHCKGSGHRLRWGRHVTNYLHRTRERSTRASRQHDRLVGRRTR
jgi:hypothetical protein